MFTVKWRTFNYCNFSCSYCIQNHKIKDYSSVNIERLIKQAKQINDLLANIKDDNLWFDMAGGEISLVKWDDFKLILDELKDSRIHNFYITSNFSAPYSWYSNLVKYFKERNIRLTLTLSLHEEFFKPELFINKAYKLKDEFDNFKIQMVVTKSNQDIVKYFVDKASEKNINYVVDYDRNVNWKEEEKIFKTKASKATELRCKLCNTINTKGMICSNNEYCITIKNGIIYGVDCKQKTPCGILGSTKEIIPQHIICQKEQCSFCGRFKLVDKNNIIVFDNVHENK